MLRVQFEEDLEKLHNQFYAMGKWSVESNNRTVRAFVTHDRELARQVIDDVDEYEVEAWAQIFWDYWANSRFHKTFVSWPS